MATVFLLDLAYATAVAFSPTPIVVVILMLFSGSARHSARAFVLGWVVGLSVLGVVVYQLTRAGILLSAVSESFPRPLVPLLLGVGLVFLARVEWRRAPKPGESVESPKWLDSADRLLTKSGSHVTSGRAFVIAFLMSAVSPKNILLMLAFSLALIEANLGGEATAIFLGIFIFISSVTIGLPVLYALLMGDEADETLYRWKTWLLQNTGRMAALFIGFLGVLLVAKSIADLFGFSFA